MDCDWPGLYHVIPINQSLQATQTYTINGIMYTVHCVQLSLWSAVIGHSHHMVPDLSLADIRTSELPPGRHLSIGQMWSSKRTGQKLCVCLYYWHFFCEWRGILCTPYSSKWGGRYMGAFRFQEVPTHRPPQPQCQGWGEEAFPLSTWGHALPVGISIWYRF